MKSFSAIAHIIYDIYDQRLETWLTVLEYMLLHHEDQGSDPSTHSMRLTEVHDSSSKESHALLWPLWVPSHTCVHLRWHKSD